MAQTRNLWPVRGEDVCNHRHGVEVVLQGSYADMVQYMQALQAMPTRVFWGKAQLAADTYPGATLTLTLYTLSMDDTWIAL